MTKTTNTAALTVAAVLTLLPGLAGCSGTTPESAPSTRGAATGTSGGASLASCLRDEGYDVPDPSANDRVHTVDKPDGVDEEQWHADLEQCLQGTGAGGAAGEAGSAGSPEQLRAASECIREHGFADYPDSGDAQREYEAADEDTFAEVSEQCVREAFADGATK